MKEIHKDNDLYLIPGHDLNKMIAVTKLLLKLKPNLNAIMMNWLGYLHDIEPQDNDEWDDWHDYWDDDFVNQGDLLLTLTSEKLNIEILSPLTGVVKQLKVSQGKIVEQYEPLLTINDDIKKDH